MKLSKTAKANQTAKVSRPTDSLLSNSPVYTLLALYMPLTILAALAFLLREILPNPFPASLPIICGSISAIAASFYCDFMKDDKASRTAADIRGAIIIAAFAYLLSSLLREAWASPGIWGRRFMPSLASIASAIAGVYAWNTVISLKQLFKARKRFDEYTEMYQGEKLHEALFGDAGLLQYTDFEIVKTRRNYLIQMIAVCVLLVGNTIANNRLSIPLYILMLCVLESGMCVIGFLGIFRKEQYYASDGLVFSPYHRIKCMLGIGIFSALCIALSLLLSTGKNILDFSYVVDFFKWLFGLLKRNPQAETQMLPPEVMIPPMPMDMGPLPFAEPEATQRRWPIWKILQYAAVILAAAGFIWFMIAPLLDRSKKAGRPTAAMKARRIIAEWYKGIIGAVIALINYIKNDRSRRKLNRLRKQKPGLREIINTSEAVLGAYAHAKRQDIRQSATLFAKLIVWGGMARGVAWKPSHAPGEYCRLLSAAGNVLAAENDPPAAESNPPAAAALADMEEGNDILRQNNGIIRCGELFEQALYSAEVLSHAERTEFQELVEEITSS